VIWTRREFLEMSAAGLDAIRSSPKTVHERLSHDSEAFGGFEVEVRGKS
jgi:hypothetical protein